MTRAKPKTPAKLAEPLVTDEEAAAFRAMDEAVAAAAEARSNGAPAVIESGRYRVFVAPDGGWVIARAVDTCDRCQGCGCGDQAEPVQIPAMVIQLARSGGTGLMGKLKALRNGV